MCPPKFADVLRSSVLSHSATREVTRIPSFLYYNHGHNIMRIYDVLPNFPFTTSETKPDY